MQQYTAGMAGILPIRPITQDNQLINVHISISIAATVLHVPVDPDFRIKRKRLFA